MFGISSKAILSSAEGAMMQYKLLTFAILFRLILAKEVLDSIDGSEEVGNTTASSLYLPDQDVTEAYVAFEVGPKDTTVRGGKRLHLECSAFGNPPPVISWYYNDALLQITDSKEDKWLETQLNEGKWQIGEAVTSSKLVIPCLRKKDDGLYKCVASNGRQTIQSKAKVTVFRGRGCRKKNLVRAPVIVIWSSERMENFNRAVQLLCRTFSGVPRIITWYNGNGTRISDNTFRVLSNGDLLITEVKPDMMGTYTCVARNSFGEDRTTSWFIPMDPGDHVA